MGQRICTAVTLHGVSVRLEPLEARHTDDLRAAVEDGGQWALWYTDIPAPTAISAAISERMSLMATGQILPFAAIDLTTGQAVGMTSYLGIDEVNRRIEIGNTWYSGSVQRSGFNTEAKLLLLEHAFDTLDCIAVEFRTHAMNRRSRAAIERLGAKLDGILRSHRRASNGSLRDTCVYSILAHEWPAVRTNLRWLLDQPPKPWRARNTAGAIGKIG